MREVEKKAWGAESWEGGEKERAAVADAIRDEGLSAKNVSLKKMFHSHLIESRL